MNKHIKTLDLVLIIFFIAVLFSCAGVPDTVEAPSLIDKEELIEITDPDQQTDTAVEEITTVLEIDKKVDLSEFADAERVFLLKHINTFSYLVYFNPKQTTYKDSADRYLFFANSYLENNHLNYISKEDIDVLIDKQYHRLVNEDPTQSNNIEYVIHKFDANIYLELTVEESKVVLTCFDAKDFSEITESAINIDTTKYSEKKKLFFNFMKEVISLIQEKKLEEAVDGIKYKIYFEEPVNDNKIKNLINILSAKVEKIEKDTSEKGRIVYDVYLLGDIHALEKILCESVENNPDLKNFRIIMQIKDSLTIYLGS